MYWLTHMEAGNLANVICLISYFYGNASRNNINQMFWFEFEVEARQFTFTVVFVKGLLHCIIIIKVASLQSKLDFGEFVSTFIKFEENNCVLFSL